jgi:Ankyrin repeats (3 copies)
MRTWALERKFVMPVKRLPSNPNLDHLKYQAKDLLQGHSAHSAEVAQRLREFHPGLEGASDDQIFTVALTLSDAQLAIAREYGFPSWARLKAHIQEPTRANQLHLPHHERIEDDTFRRAVNLLDAGNQEGLRSLLKQHPDLVHQHVTFEGGNYFCNPTLLEFVAENPIRHRTLPSNIVEVARVILEAGAEQTSRTETLMLVSTGMVPRECGVQIPLIDLLCDYGADPSSAIHAAAFHEEIAAVNALILRGARIDLTLAAALARVDDFSRLLPAAGDRERHLALAMASQFGQLEIVRMLLDAGEDPNRYNPTGAHSHATPLHQAAFAGHEKVVRLLVERGASVDLKDILWQGTPADWAEHAGRVELEAYLRAQQKGKDKQD